MLFILSERIFVIVLIMRNMQSFPFDKLISSAPQKFAGIIKMVSVVMQLFFTIYSGCFQLNVKTENYTDSIGIVCGNSTNK